MFEVPKEVINSNGERGIVIDVVVKFKDGIQNIFLDNFNEHYEEYVDPKDLEIARLKKQLADLKEKHKSVRKKKRTLTPQENAEVTNLLRAGESNTAIANQYDISESSVSRKRKMLEKQGVL